MHVFGKVCVVSLVCLTAFGCEKEEEEEKGMLEGTWARSCGTNDTGSDTPEYDNSNLVFTKDSYTVTFNSFSDTACATAKMSFQITGSYSLGADVAAPAGAKAMDRKVGTAALTLHADEQLTNFNEGTVCGGSWVKGTAKVVTKELCVGFDDLLELLEDEYTVAKVDGTNLYMGEQTTAADGKTAATRHLELETRAAVKVP